ncbi:MAG: carbon-nitrogen hydrolase family protein [Corynebacterium sp.]|nr:carbon-nitrogen hydrolase family protein [Corynebacterium sp.]
MKIAIGQISTGPNKTDNLELVTHATTVAAQNQAQLIVFPEATMQAFGTGRLDETAEPLDGAFVDKLTTLAHDHNIAIVLGMFRPADQITTDGKTINRVFNTAIVVQPDGTRIHYDKIHTYDAFGYRESDTVKPGNQLVTFTYDNLTFGLATCYDLRFPEQFRQLARRGAEVILVPISWAGGPGKLQQRQLLIQARALDSTSWLVAADQTHYENTTAPRGVGHSAFVRPDGSIAMEAGEDTEVLLFDTDPHLVHHMRTQIPVLVADETYD